MCGSLAGCSTCKNIYREKYTKQKLRKEKKNNIKRYLLLEEIRVCCGNII